MYLLRYRILRRSSKTVINRKSTFKPPKLKMLNDASPEFQSSDVFVPARLLSGLPLSATTDSALVVWAHDPDRSHG